MRFNSTFEKMLGKSRKKMRKWRAHVNIIHKNVYKTLLGNMADCMLLMKDVEKAWFYSRKLLEIREKDKDFYGLALSHNGFAGRYMKEGNSNRAIYHSKKSYEFA